MDPAVDRWRQGNRKAGDDLVRTCEPALQAFFRRRSVHDADDLVQRTLVACVEAIEHFEDRSAFKSFLLGIAHNQLLMDLRASRARERKESLYASSGMAPFDREFEPDPDELFTRSEEARIVAAAMNDTPHVFQRVLRMFYWDDLSVEQIATALAVPPGTVKSRLARGRSWIAARIAPSILSCSIREVDPNTCADS
jgi:RNA polymerase sigma-70 factor (ECF subfamily)